MRRALAWMVSFTCLSACGGAMPPPNGAAIAVGSASAAPTATLPSRDVRWAIPGCPLRYEILVTERFESAGGPMEAVSFQSIAATPHGDRLRLDLAVTSRLRQGKHLPYGVADAGFPPLEIVTDGRSVRPAVATSLWNGLGTQGGLAWLFPDLAGTAWSFPVDVRFVNQNGVSTLQSRAFELTPPEKKLGFMLRVETSTLPDGRLQVRARGPEEWSSRSPDGGANDFAILDRKGEIRTEHVLLPNGRLLRAHLERDVDLALTVKEATSPQPLRSRLTQRSDAHLVAACDGPTEATLAPVLSREERAIAAVGELDVAVLTPDKHASAPGAFSAAVRKHGDKAILETIDRYQKRYGVDAWALPGMLRDEDVVVRGDRVVVSEHTAMKHPTMANTRTPVTFAFELIEEGGRFVVDRVVATSELLPGRPQVLEIALGQLSPK